jgi:hypothetical protein
LLETPRFEAEDNKRQSPALPEETQELQRKLKLANERALNFEREFIITKAELTSEISRFNRLHALHQQADKLLGSVLSGLASHEPSSSLYQQIRVERERYEASKESLALTPRHSTEGISQPWE